MDKAEIKTLSFCAYLGPLWLIGLLGEGKTSRRLRFHLNQGACLFIFEMLAALAVVIVSALVGLIPAVGGVMSAVISWVGGAAVFGCALWLTVCGMLGVYNEKTEKLPIVGGFSVIPY